MEGHYVPFAKRPEWSDIEPLPQDDGPHGGVCVIAYSDQFRDTMNYFRAIVHKDEKSERALSLTAEVIELNAANYTAWFFRRQILEALKSDIQKELNWTAGIAEENPKNYQIWYHRRALLERAKELGAAHELEFTARMIKEDSKNYHAWAHRQWIVEEFGLWEEELKYVDEMIQDDIRNNSAWNQRYFVLSKTKDINSLEIKKQEIEYAFGYIRKAPNNQSPWNYVKGLFKGGRFDEVPELRERCLEFRANFPTCAHVVSLLVDIWLEVDTPESLILARDGCETLANQLAQTQKKYWTYRYDLVLQKLRTGVPQ
jgi:protein farnesyltransferase/geranylgeranyltransferase type-1 subunit alpha